MYDATPNDTAQSPPSLMPARVSAALLALVMGYFFMFQPIRGLWVQHWLVKDGVQGTAMVTSEHWAGHNMVVYEYRVGTRVYSGRARRSLQNPKYANVRPGEKTIVYFSRSHPWISAIDLPAIVMIPGLPVALVAWVLGTGFIITAVNPRSKWAFDLSGQRRPIVVKRPQRRGSEIAKDIVLLIVCGALVVVGMVAFGIGINALFGRR